ncbi:MAG: response regulator [Planctomycetes bacterium]|nr:response regulator [Planctomycetota bacterium]
MSETRDSARVTEAQVAELDALLGGLADPVLRCSVHGRVIGANRAARQRGIRTGSQLLERVRPSDRPLVQMSLASAARGRAVRELRLQWLEADARWCPVALGLGDCAAPAGSVLVRLRDVDGQSRAERALERLRHGLELVAGLVSAGGADGVVAPAQLARALCAIRDARAACIVERTAGGGPTFQLVHGVGIDGELFTAALADGGADLDGPQLAARLARRIGGADAGGLRGVWGPLGQQRGAPSRFGAVTVEVTGREPERAECAMRDQLGAIALSLRPLLVEPAAGGIAAARTQAQRVLVVDDDAGVRTVVCAMLEQLGATALANSDVEGARRALVADGGVDVLVCDLGLEVEPGRELADWALASFPDLRVVVCSGRIGAATAGLVQRHAARAVALEKPFLPAELRDAIAHVSR